MSEAKTELLPERKEPEGFRLRVLNRNDLKLEDYYYLEDLLKRRTPSPAQPDERLSAIRELILDYGSASFDCGAWDAEDSNEVYEQCLARQESAKAKLLASLEGKAGVSEQVHRIVSGWASSNPDAICDLDALCQIADVLGIEVQAREDRK